MLEVFAQTEYEANFEVYGGRDLDPDLDAKVKKAGRGAATLTVAAAMVSGINFCGGTPSASASEGSGVLHTEVQQNPVNKLLRDAVKATVKRDANGNPQIVEAEAPVPAAEVVGAEPAAKVPQPDVQPLAKEADAPGAGDLVRGFVKGSLNLIDRDAEPLTAPQIGGEEVKGTEGDVQAASNEQAADKPVATEHNIHDIDITQYKFADMSDSNWVFLAQKKLNHLGYELPVTGNFGPLTKTAIMRFQFDHGLVADGVVGMATKQALMDGMVPAEGDRINQRKPLVLWSAEEILSGEDLHNGRGRDKASYINGIPVISHQYQRDLGNGPRPHRGVDLPFAKGHKILAVGTAAKVWYDAAGGGLVIEQTHPSMPGSLIQVLHCNSAFGKSWTYYRDNGKQTFEVDPAEVGRKIIGEVGNTGIGQGAHSHIGVKMLDGKRYGQQVQSGAENFILVRSTLPHLLHWGFEEDIHVAMGPPAFKDHGNRLDVAAVPNVSDIQALKGEVVAAPLEAPAPVEVQAEAPASAPEASGEYIPFGGRVSENAAERVMADPKGAASLVDVARHMGLDPIEFVALMSWESGGTLNPNAMGGDRDEYKGLIQFSPSNAIKYGVEGQISISEMAPAVMEYLIDRGFRPGEHDIRHAYSAILVGTAREDYRHPKTGKLAWDIPDSNTTTVRNAHKYFQGGAHHERARSFLEASLGSVPTKPVPQEVIVEEPPAEVPEVSAIDPASAKEGAPAAHFYGEEIELEPLDDEPPAPGLFGRLGRAFTQPSGQSFQPK
ncbi:peptidoglycan-binding protein [Leptolyngbya sp. CCNP1308]|uniref:peptidoglycan-binding protein n=1 Tax=Leptolyngbya sp. CCNP1308 TaxID=3110255 RepID=UPI002B205406|nr:peptidoglycan-binding protein [Leptolyngbya sp. CCNP1308]MEA5447607.1 peptidoglycan-binding protein [Leptolyngbya sp. CCNP1308]